MKNVKYLIVAVLAVGATFIASPINNQDSNSKHTVPSTTDSLFATPILVDDDWTKSQASIDAHEIASDSPSNPLKYRTPYPPTSKQIACQSKLESERSGGNSLPGVFCGGTGIYITSTPSGITEYKEAPKTALAQNTADNCDSNYSGCVPVASDVDCAGGSGNGPAYVKGPVRVIGSDIYDLDRDNDGIACE